MSSGLSCGLAFPRTRTLRLCVARPTWTASWIASCAGSSRVMRSAALARRTRLRAQRSPTGRSCRATAAGRFATVCGDPGWIRARKRETSRPPRRLSLRATPFRRTCATPDRAPPDPRPHPRRALWRPRDPRAAPAG